MLILEPTAGEKTITIVPRSTYVSGVIVMRLRRDGDGAKEYLTPSLLTNIVGFTQVVFTPTILKEDATYYLEITNDDELWYRDKIYCTSQTPTERILNKHEIGNGTIYKSYDVVDDNTYII